MKFFEVRNFFSKKFCVILSPYTPEYAEKPPSMGRTTPVIKLAASLLIRKRSPPSSSHDSPNLPMGVAARILPVRAVGVPSGLKRSAAFCFVEKKPGAMALTLMPTFEKCTASHWVKLDIAALAPEYAGILVRGVYAFIEEMLMMLQPSRPTI